MATLGRLMSLLSPFDVVIWMTDGWPLYESRLKGKLHVISPSFPDEFGLSIPDFAGNKNLTFFLANSVQSDNALRNIQGPLSVRPFMQIRAMEFCQVTGIARIST